MKKKGILFTVTTIFLLLAVFLLSSAYLTRNKELQRTATLSLAGDKLSYIYDDVGNNIYRDMIGTNISVSRSGNFVTITLQQPDISSSSSQSQLMLNYETFIESTYKNLNNFQISLTGFNNIFTIAPYNAQAIINNSIFYFYTKNTTALQNISIEVVVDEIREQDNSHFPAVDPGQIPVSVKFYQNGSEIYSESKPQDPSEENTYFAKTFQDSGPPIVHGISGIYVQFGTYNSQDGVLRVWVDNLNANITKMDITYTAQENTRIKGGNISITSAVENITKQTEIILAEE
jgi:hypothetical protein